jgi:hypothetical protein
VTLRTAVRRRNSRYAGLSHQSVDEDINNTQSPLFVELRSDAIDAGNDQAVQWLYCGQFL